MPIRRLTAFLFNRPFTHLDELEVFRRIAPAKDVDGLGTINLGKIAQEDETGFVCCTPAGIMELLARSGVTLAGKHVVVLDAVCWSESPLRSWRCRRKPGPMPR